MKKPSFLLPICNDQIYTICLFVEIENTYEFVDSSNNNGDDDSKLRDNDRNDDSNDKNDSKLDDDDANGKDII